MEVCDLNEDRQRWKFGTFHEDKAKEAGMGNEIWGGKVCESTPMWSAWISIRRFWSITSFQNFNAHRQRPIKVPWNSGQVCRWETAIKQVKLTYSFSEGRPRARRDKRRRTQDRFPSARILVEQLTYPIVIMMKTPMMKSSRPRPHGRSDGLAPTFWSKLCILNDNW